MSENIFRSELIAKYNTKNRTDGVGGIVIWNNIPTICLKPEPFYQNLEDGTISSILRYDFIPNTQYIIDLYADYDGSYASNAYRTGGLTVYYSDGTNSGATLRGTGGDGVGFQHKKIITPAGVSVTGINVYYSYNVPVYYRLDSYISPVSTLSIQKNGQLKTTNTIEDKNPASFLKGGSIYCNQFYEY